MIINMNGQHYYRDHYDQDNPQHYDNHRHDHDHDHYPYHNDDHDYHDDHDYQCEWLESH